MLTPLTEHQLLLFWLQLLLLFAVARALGALMVRIGQPAVVGELGAGLLVGPSVFGRIAPDWADYLFPGDPEQSGIILGVAWIGAFLLLVVTGLETDVKLLRSLGRQSTFVSIGSFIVPLAGGTALGWMMPAVFVGDEGTRTTFAMFMGVAMSISALPVVARILSDMNLMRRNIGQMTLAGGMSNALAGLILLGVIAGIVTTGGFEAGQLAITLGATFIFIVIAFTLGQRLVDAGLRRSLRGGYIAGPLSVSVGFAALAGAITQGIGVEAVLGAFIAGIVLGRSRYQTPEVTRTLEVMSNSVFAPIFFATSGLFVDLGTVSGGTGLAWALIVLGVAAATKILGASAGGWVAKLRTREGLAVGVGLNARGEMVILLATVPLSLGVFNQTSYTVVILMAVVTSMAAPPLLPRVLQGLQPDPEEAARLEREELLSSSVIAHARSALLPTRGGRNSIVAAMLIDLWLRPEANVSVFTVLDRDDEDVSEDPGILRALSAFTERPAELRTETSDDPVRTILDESRLGYDVIALGLNEDFVGSHELGNLIRGVLAGSQVPVLLVRTGADVEGEGTPRLRFQRIVVPATGTREGRAAEEIAYSLASKTGARLDTIHVVSRADKLPEPAQVGHHHPMAPVRGVIVSSLDLAKRFGQVATGIVRTGRFAHEELLETANERHANLIVLGTQLRTRNGGPFLGHGVEFLLEHAPQTVAAIVLPPAGDAE